MHKRVDNALHGIKAGQVADRGDHNSRCMAGLLSRCSTYVRTQAAQHQPSAYADLIQNDCFTAKSGTMQEEMIGICMSVYMPVHQQPLLSMTLDFSFS